MPSSSSVSKLVGLVPLFLLTLTAHITLAQKLPIFSRFQTPRACSKPITQVVDRLI